MVSVGQIYSLKFERDGDESSPYAVVGGSRITLVGSPDSDDIVDVRIIGQTKVGTDPYRPYDYIAQKVA